MEIKNALIKRADIIVDPYMVYWIDLDYGGAGQAFGGVILGGDFGCEAIKRLLEVVDCYKWSQLTGKPVRVLANHGKVHKIGHFLSNKWLDLEELATEFGLK